MKSLLFIISIVFFLAISATPSFARSGCCSHHGGVSGCGCADGTPLSNTCAPYYPECSQGGEQAAPQTQTQTETSSTPPATYTPISNTPTAFIPKPTAKPKVKKKKVKHTKKKKETPKPKTTPTPTPQKNFFQMLFGL